MKDHSPRWAKDVANVGTRQYALVTARWRPLPDFLVVGTKRGGSTSMWNWLTEHPAVLPMFPSVRGLKSTHYFFDGGSAGLRYYRSHFHSTPYRKVMEKRCGHPIVCGEASPLYMFDPRVAPQVVEVVPQVKVIMLLRDPVTRAVSHWQERVKEGVETLSFSDALDAEEERTRGERDRMMQDPGYYSEAFDFFTYRERGVYAPQVEQWRRTFPTEQVLILPSEEFSGRPQQTMDRVSDFLGVPRHPVRIRHRHNVSPSAEVDDRVLDQLRAYYRPHNRELYRLLGEDLGWS